MDERISKFVARTQDVEMHILNDNADGQVVILGYCNYLQPGLIRFQQINSRLQCFNSTSGASNEKESVYCVIKPDYNIVKSSLCMEMFSIRFSL